MPRPVTLGMVVLDTPDPRALGAFYAGVTDWQLDPDDTSDTWVTLRSGQGGTALAFQRVEHLPSPTWPGTDVPQQSHLDLHVPAYEPWESRVLDLGGRLLDAPVDHPTWRVYADPDGHPFCLCLVDDQRGDGEG